MCLRKFLMISAAWAWAGLIPLQAQIATPPISFNRNYVSPPVGLGSSETASITVVNNTTTLLTPATTVATPCTGTVSFSNANGTIGTATSFSLTPGQFETVTLPFSAAGLTGIRGEIRGEVSATLPAASSTFCSLVLSFETYDSTTGATHFVLSGSLASPLVPVTPILPLPQDR